MPSRRGHREGNIRKREVRDRSGEVVDERWEARVTLPDGRRKSLYGATRAEVAAKLRTSQDGLLKGVLPPSDLLTMGVYLEQWLEETKLSIEPTTTRRYTQHVRMLIARLGTRRVTKLSPEDLRRMYAELLEEGYASSSLHVMHSILHHALKDAIARGVAAHNVAELIPAPRNDSPEIRPLSRDEVRVLLEGTRDLRTRALWVLAISTGMRLGEIMAIEWKDLDLGRRTLTVKRSSYFKTGVGTIAKATKTKSSRRTIRLDSGVVAELKAHRSRQHEERLAAGLVWTDLDLVFCNQAGGYYHQSSIWYQLKKLLKAHDLPDIRFHDLRHTAATLMLANGVNIKSVSEMLGHSSVAITLGIYTHVTEDMQEHAARVMGDLLFR